MAFRSFDELINMARHDPKMAKAHVAQAKKMGMPVVSRNNPGYNEDEDPMEKAINKRLSRALNSSKKRGDDRLKSAVRDRMQRYMRSAPRKMNNSMMMSSNKQDPIVEKRKKVGYYSE